MTFSDCGREAETQAASATGAPKRWGRAQDSGEACSGAEWAASPPLKHRRAHLHAIMLVQLVERKRVREQSRVRLEGTRRLRAATPQRRKRAVHTSRNVPADWMP